MRTYLLMLLALGVSAAAFFLYIRSQGTLRKTPGEQTATGSQPLDIDVEHEGDLGPGQRPWIRVLDSMRRLQYRFGTEDYTPRGGGRIDVRGVEAHFFQYIDESKDPKVRKFRTQQVRIHGKTGHIEVQESPKASSNGFDKGSSGPPKRGLLNDVTIYVISRWTPDIEAQLRQPGGEQRLANITATMPNISFDNETFEVTTHEYLEADGTFVPADQVPVHATGDYEFNGKGMTLRWNELDGRLEYLEVAHGNYLVVRDAEMLGKAAPGGFGPADRGPTTLPAAQAWAGEPVTPLLDSQGNPLQFAAAGRTHVAAAPAAAGGKPGASPKPGAGKKKQKGPLPPYRATFDDNITILQGEPEVSESEVARADVMLVEFQSGSKNPATKPSTQAATKPAAPPKNAPLQTPAAPAPATQPAVAAATAKSPQTRPATRPTEQAPLIIRWTGKLRVVPIDEPGDIPPALKPGESIVHLIGQKAPVHLMREAMHAWCAAADYFSTDGSAQLRKSDQFGPVRLRQVADPTAKGGAQEADIVTQQINYSASERVAVLHGDSTAHIILPQQPSTRPTDPATRSTIAAAKPATKPVAQAMDASWTKQGRLHFHPATAGTGMAFERAELEGDVDVKHPQMAMRSQKLELYFEEKPATRPSTMPATQPAAADAIEPHASLPASQPTTKPVTQSILKRMVATTRVWCDLTDSAGRRQTVTTDRLTMSTALDKEGKLYPQFITADGKAHAYDGQQDLKAGHLELTLAPATRPAERPASRSTTASSAEPTNIGGMDTASVELQQMRAWTKVAVRNSEGSTAYGDWMDVHVVNGQPVARIVGSPLAAATTYGWMGRRFEPIARLTAAPLASVTDAKGSRASGPIIDFDPRRDWAKITGRGTIRAIQDTREEKPATQPARQPATRPATQPAPKFADIFWEREAELDGAKNRITVSGPVLISSIEPDGTRQTATGRRAVIELIDRPATQPATKPVAKPTPPAAPGPPNLASGKVSSGGASSTRPSNRTAKSQTRPSGGAAGIAGGGINVLQDKVVSAFNLEKDAVVNSTLADAHGILRQTEIRSDTLRYETGETATTASTRPTNGSPMAIGSGGNGRLLAPGPGTMIFRDHRPPATRPANGEAPAPGQARGATAFRWEKGMSFDEPARKAVMQGGVLIVHQADEPDAEPVRVNGDRVEAMFEPKPEPASKPAAPANKPGVATSRNAKPASPQTADSPEQAMQLKWLTIDGNVMMVRAGATLTATRADFNPATGWMVAVGTQQAPATFSNADGSDITWADQIHWNTQNWTAKFFGLRGRANSGDKGSAAPGKPR